MLRLPELTGSMPGLLFSSLDDDNRLGVFTNADADVLALFKRQNGVTTQIGGGSIAINNNQTYTVRVERDGAVIRAWLNGVLAFTHTLTVAEQAHFSQDQYSKVGFRGSSHTAFDDLNVAGTGVAPGTPGADADSCALGVAQTLFRYACPVPVHWRNNGHADPIIRFNDHTSSTWPVSSRTYAWNAAQNIDVRYHWNSCPFLAGARCVDVYNADYYNHSMNARWGGIFSATYDPVTRALNEQNARIMLNDYYLPANPPDKTTAHEIGHALGLGHGSSTDSVMWYAPYQASTSIGHVDDFAYLALLYSVNR